MQAFVDACKGDFQDIESDYKEMEESFEKIVEYFGEPISSTPEQLFGTVLLPSLFYLIESHELPWCIITQINSFMIAFERAHEDNLRKAEAKNKQSRNTSAAKGFTPNDRSGGGKPQNIDEVVNQLRSGALFLNRRIATDAAMEAQSSSSSNNSNTKDPSTVSQSPEHS